MKSEEIDQVESKLFARRLVALGCLIPLLNCVAAAAMGVLVVYSDADDNKFLAGLLSAANVGGWLWWLTGSVGQLRESIKMWWKMPHAPHPGFRLAGLVSFGGALCWVGVLCLLAYGMLG